MSVLSDRYQARWQRPGEKVRMNGGQVRGIPCWCQRQVAPEQIGVLPHSLSSGAPNHLQVLSF